MKHKHKKKAPSTQCVLCNRTYSLEDYLSGKTVCSRCEEDQQEEYSEYRYPQEETYYD